ncbi:MAG TPA: glycoside hydrolase family 9 protein [Abditibacteriaceae bacterium]|jgi:endoglucanase
MLPNQSSPESNQSPRLAQAPAQTSAQGNASRTTSERRQQSDQVKVCQVGYLPQETKFAVVTAAPGGQVVVRRVNDGGAVLTVAAGAPQQDPDSGDTVRAIDFSALTQPGTYYLDVPGVGSSYDFRIGTDVFARPFRLSMRAFTGQRCGTNVSLGPDFPEFHYTACHTQHGEFHPSSGKQGTKDVSGGWHDAGDYGKYVVNSGITTGTLLWAYELYGAKVGPVKLDLPESGRPTPDMLAEIRWNIAWMLKMQDEDGGVWHKATTANFPGFIMPEADKAPVLIIGSGTEPYKTTAATGDFAAVCAIAGRLYRPFDPAFADQCLTAAERAWAWMRTHPDHNFTRNPQGVNTGGYGDSNPADERLWAAAELFRTTGKNEYNDYFTSHYTAWSPTIRSDSAQGWPNVANLAMYSYALPGQAGSPGQAGADAKVVQKIKADAVAAADAIVERSRRNGYRIPLGSNEYIWGSNSVVANYAMMVLFANQFTPKADYINCAQDSLHYLLGRNTFNTSYVTQLGTKWAMNPHHRPSAADKVDQPWPGMLVGGPNANRRTPPARQWEDVAGSYTTNEIAINWNAPLVFMLAHTLS